MCHNQTVHLGHTKKDIQKDTPKTYRIQDKGSRFVVLDSDC